MTRLSLTTLVLCAVSVCSAQQSDQLQQQMQELKEQYAQTTREFEQRIAALEQQIAKTKEAAAPKEGTVSAEALAKEAAEKAVSGGAAEVGAKFQGKVPAEPTYDLLQEADQKIEKLTEQIKGFEFHGYFRSGYGLNGAGGQQVAFQAPGAGAKFR